MSNRSHEPRTLRELIEFLQLCPHVTCRWQGQGEFETRTFEAHRQGGLWFKKKDGQDVFLPVNCGLTPAESGFKFRKDGFDLTKFGHTLEFYYA